MDIVTLTLAVVLPWLAGASVLLAIDPPRARAPGDAAWTIGAGWFAGVLLLTAWMRLLSLVGIAFGRASIAAPLLVIAVAGVFIAGRRQRIDPASSWRSAMATLRGADLSRAARLAWYAVLAWLLVRAVLLLVEIAWQPLYPWDAWIQWATKARVWYELGHIVPFVREDAWFAAPSLVYFDASPNYPATLPLLQVWANVMLGRWDDSLMNVPWWACGVAFVFVCYAALRRFGFGPLGALIGSWLVTSLPLANVHVALAGYADLPMAMFYTCAALALLRWLDERTIGRGVIVLAFVVGLPTIKIPGIAWALTLLPGALVVWFRPRGRTLLLGLAGIAVLVALILTRSEAVILGYHMHLDFAPAWGPVAESLFLLGNWHLLWYGAFAIAIIAYKFIFAPDIEPLTAIVFAGLFFLLIVFGYTNAREWVVEQTTVNRAVLHLAPLLSLWALASFARWRRAQVESAAPPTAVPAASA
ncbi:MAG TPA: hypothetical protein VMV45_13820 [Casimicrobiaceae bacterium]|nr:hypothetical protein [Casimicrobiaceae bacterium]